MYTKEELLRVKKTVLASISTILVISMKDNGKMVCKKEMESIIIRMEMFMKGLGRKEKRKEKVF